MLERCLSGYAVASFPMAKNTGLAHTFATAADRERVKNILRGATVVLTAMLTYWGALALAAAAFGVLVHYRFVAEHQFGGITGDLAGWFLQRAELWMLAALAACQWGGVL